MKYILDTNVYIKILKGSSENIKKKYQILKMKILLSLQLFVLNFIMAHLKVEETLYSLKLFLHSFNTLAFDDNAAKKCGQIRANLAKEGTPIGPYDLIIASLALSHDLILVTHNTKEFSRIEDLRIEEWEI